MVSNTETLLDQSAYFTHRYDAANEIVTRLTDKTPEQIVELLTPVAQQLWIEVDAAFKSDHRNDSAYASYFLYEQVNDVLKSAIYAIQGPAE